MSSLHEKPEQGKPRLLIKFISKVLAGAFRSLLLILRQYMKGLWSQSCLVMNGVRLRAQIKKE